MAIELLHRAGEVWTVALLWEPRDMWVGLYWTHPVWEGPDRTATIYVCIVPMLPIRIGWVIESVI
jgi:hypothetical protein